MRRETIYSNKYRDLARKLRQARTEAGLTQVQAGRRLGRPQSYVSKVEAGQYYLDVFDLQRLANVYRRKVEDFL